MSRPDARSARYDLSPPDDAQRRALEAALTPEEQRVLLQHGTEAPFCGGLLDNKQPGIYGCRECGLPLFVADRKFNSGTGWPPANCSTMPVTGTISSNP